MTRSIFIPTGMKTIDALAAKPAYARHSVEVCELNRLHDMAAQHLDPSVLSRVPKPHTRWRLKVFTGKVKLPISGEGFQLTSHLWGTTSLTELSNPKNYLGNIGLIRFSRDIAVFVGGDHVPGYADPDRKVQVHFGGSGKLVADWRKSLYLLKLAESDDFLEQFVGAGEGLDAFAERYFGGDRTKSRGFAINIFSAAIFEKLGWKTARSSRACMPYKDRQRESSEIVYRSILLWSRNMHGYDPMLPLGVFVQKLLHMDDEDRSRPMADRGGSSFFRFGKMYWSWRKAGVDTSEMDEIFSRHGLGYHQAPVLYEEFIELAREKGFSTEQLSQIAVQRRMMDEPVSFAYSPSGHQVLLEAFHDYGVETDDLAPLLRENAYAYIGSRINEWHATPRPRGSLFTHLGLTMLEYPSFIKWARRYVGQAEAQIVKAEAERYLANRRSVEHGSLYASDRRPFELTTKAAPADNGSSLEVFEDLLNDADLLPDVIDRLENAMRPVERIKGSLPPIQLRRLRNIFAKELGSDVVAAALKEAGIKID